MRVSKHSKTIYIFLGIAIFLIMYIFYTQIEPIMVCDPDDWTYISYIRIPLPLWKNWNPTRVLPETIMGMLGYFAVYLIYPFTSNYILSFTYVYASAVAFIISLYIIFLAKMINKIFGTSHILASLLSFCVFLIHFILFRESVGQISKFLFTASNLTCFMFYIVPTLVNAIVAFGFIIIETTGSQRDDVWEIVKNNRNNKTIISIGGILVLLYFSILSNMACNIILIAPCTYIFLKRIFEKIKENKIRELISVRFIKRNIIYIYLFMMELLCLIFEANGGRANSLEVNWATAFSRAIIDLYTVYSKSNKLVITCVTIIIVIALLLAFINRKNKQDISIKKFFGISYYSLILVNVYMFLLFSRVGDNKIARSENILTMLIYGFVICAGSAAYILRKFDLVTVIIPFITVITFIYVVGGNYESSISYYGGNIKMCMAVNENIIQQFIVADINNVDELELHIPESGLGNYSFSGERIATTLYKHGVVSKRYYPTIVLENENYFSRKD